MDFISNNHQLVILEIMIDVDILILEGNAALKFIRTVRYKLETVSGYKESRHG